MTKLAPAVLASAIGIGVLAGPATAAVTPRAAETTARQAASVSAIRAVWPNALENTALRIAWRESRYNASAISRSGDYGTMQINWQAHRGWLRTMGITNPRQLLDPMVNARVAYRLYQLNGWRPWRATVS
jgi:soluble lytic murein transglycosylase-like protein